MASDLALQKAAQAWCTSTTKCIEMDSRLANAFASILDEVIAELKDEAFLGNATTRELLLEITTRIEIDGKLEYRSVD